MAVPAEHREGHDLGVGLERRGRCVGAAVVKDEHLILARVVLEHLADAPEQNADRFSFVVRRDADVQHQKASEGAAAGVGWRKLGTSCSSSHPSQYPGAWPTFRNLAVWAGECC